MLDKIYSIFLRANHNKEGSVFLSSFVFFNVGLVWSVTGIVLSPIFDFQFTNPFGFIVGVVYFMIHYYILGYSKVESIEMLSKKQLMSAYVGLLGFVFMLIAINILVAMAKYKV